MHKIPQIHHQFLRTILVSILFIGLPFCTAYSATPEQTAHYCQTPQALDENAFKSPMSFSTATNKGNMTTSFWIAAAGTIDPETPARFKAFLASEHPHPKQIVIHSPGGNLAAGLELGRLIREAGLTAHIGRTSRSFDGSDAPCGTWYDTVEAGICASSCAYAFLGGQERFVDSPYYPTEPSLLGFHQFYGNPKRGNEMLTAEQVAEIEMSTLSVAQALTGQIVLYAIEMGVDPRIVAFASATRSDDLYYPTPDEIEELSIASGSGLRPWFMEPYNGGLVTATKPHRSDSLLEQITAYCPKGSGTANFLITMDLVTPSFPNPEDLPLTAVELTIDGRQHSIGRRDLNVRYGEGSIFISVPVEALKHKIIRAKNIEFQTNAARVMGGFRESNQLDEIAQQSLALAWRNCI